VFVLVTATTQPRNFQGLKIIGMMSVNAAICSAMFAGLRNKLALGAGLSHDLLRVHVGLREAARGHASPRLRFGFLRFGVQAGSGSPAKLFQPDT
jgi:hypothetical protein